MPLHTLRGGRPGAAVAGARHLLPQLHVVGGEEPVPALAQPAPPAVINHLDVGDDVVGVEGDLIVTRSLVVIEGDGSDSKVVFIFIIGTFLS